MATVSNVTRPILVVDVAGTPVRFFRSPKSAPDLPWHALDDLFAALGLNHDLRRIQLRCAQRWFCDELRTVATADGPATIGPHVAAQGLLAAAAEAQVGGVDIASAYSSGAAAAMNLVTGGMSPIASFEFTMTAARNAGIGG